MGSISADYEGMLSAANKISVAEEEYKKNVDSLYQIIEGLKDVWQGYDNEMYTDVTTEKRATLKELGDIVNNYAVFLKRSAVTLKNVQEENASRAGKL